MDLDQQIQELIQQAPNDGATPAAVEAIAPALKQIAEQLQHPQYYILQTLEQRWAMTTLNHQAQPELQKNVVYAYADLKDALASPVAKDPQIMAFPVLVTHILFQMVAMTTVDSVIFFEFSGNLNAGTEVTRANVQELVQLYLKGVQGFFSVPPDIA